MNRLWIRLSLAFAAVIIIFSLIAALATRMTFESSFGPESNAPPEVRTYFEQVRGRSGFDPTPLIIALGVVAIGAGIWMSRTLTTPMRELGDVAQAIGHQDLSRRVNVRGTDEVKALAGRFNDMAQQLEEAESLRRNLLADVAHELRNPLHIVQGNLQAILAGVYQINEEEIARLSDQAQQLSALVDDLHELTQAEAHQLPLHKQTTDIAQLVKDAASTYQPAARTAGITLKVELLGTIPSVEADGDRIRQVMSNLLSNSLRHTPEGGEVFVTVQGQENMLAVSVRDTGAGIDPDHIDHVFDRFYRTDSARSRIDGGTGLGLAIARAIAEEHNGRIEVVSPGLDQGATFILYLPV
jgi:signal transduction histidine kinase